MEPQPNTPPFDEIGERFEESFTQRSAQLAAGAWVMEQTSGNGRVLDLGCGGGWPTAMQLANAGLDVVGVDESEHMLSLARQRVPSGDFRACDLRELPGDLGRFDAAVAFFSLLMLPKAEIPGVLASVRKLLRSGGLFVLGMVEGDMDTEPVPFFDRTVPVSAYPRDDLADLLHRSGYVVHSLDTVRAQRLPGAGETQIFIRATTKGHSTLTNIRPVSPP